MLVRLIPTVGGKASNRSGTSASPTSPETDEKQQMVIGKKLQTIRMKGLALAGAVLAVCALLSLQSNHLLRWWLVAHMVSFQLKNHRCRHRRRRRLQDVV